MTTVGVTKPTEMKTNKFKEMGRMADQVRITVLKRELYKDLIKEYSSNPETEQCPRYKDGQEFILETKDMPAGFCSWAWADIQRDVAAVFHGASFPWIERKSMIISCCTDGLRPVVFKIEKIGE